VAHDLNNVLSGIVSYPELLLLDLPPDSKLRNPIETIQESGKRAVDIVQDLLTVARGVAMPRQPLNINDLIETYRHSPEFDQIKRHYPDVGIKTDLAADLMNISGSPVHIGKALMNLVSNAVESIKGSGRVTLSTTNRYMDRPLRGYDDVAVGEYVVLSVSDDGLGISPDDLKRIFEPFYTKKVMGRSGTGLGLAVVWNILMDHKGYIDVLTSDKGTTFELYFPATREAMPAKDLPPAAQSYKGRGQRILVVDDEANQRDISCRMLEVLGYRPQAVSSGEDAVAYLQNLPVDLVLLDMIMDPGMNGRETYEQIVKMHPGQKAVIVSGFAETEDVLEAQRLGAGRFLKKPVTLERLGLAVKQELEK
jgi:CheY-like chemotaxis protein